MNYAKKHARTTVLFAAAILCATTGFSDTTFFKSADIVELVTTDHHGTAYLLFEDANKKQKIELCKCSGCSSYYHHFYEHARFRLSPTVNTASLCILSDGQIFKFPMPTFKNGGPVFPPNTKFVGPCPHQHAHPVTFNEFECRDLSADEPVVEIAFQSFSGESIRKLFNGKESIGELFKRLNRLANEMKVEAVPQYSDVFGDGALLVTKSDIIELRTKVKGIISSFNVKTINGAKSSGPLKETEPLDSFTGTGQQGMASFDFSQNDGVFTIRNGSETFKTKWSRYTSRRIYAHADLSQAIGGRSEFTVFPPSLGLAKMLDYSAKIRNLAVGEVVVFQNREGKYVAVKVLEINDKQAGASENSLTIKWKVL